MDVLLSFLSFLSIGASIATTSRTYLQPLFVVTTIPSTIHLVQQVSPNMHHSSPILRVPPSGNLTSFKNKLAGTQWEQSGTVSFPVSAQGPPACLQTEPSAAVGMCAGGVSAMSITMLC